MCTYCQAKKLQRRELHINWHRAACLSGNSNLLPPFISHFTFTVAGCIIAAASAVAISGLKRQNQWRHHPHTHSHSPEGNPSAKPQKRHCVQELKCEK